METKNPQTSQQTMKAMVQEEYGLPDVLGIRDVAKPVPSDDEVLVKMAASSVNAAEWHMVTGSPYLIRPSAGMSKPKRPVPGADIAGRVEAVGRNVTQFEVGDEVFGDIGSGAYAEYAVARERQIAHKPGGVTFEQAASSGIAGLTALQGLRDHGQLEAGQKVLINGASGGVGTFAVQIAKAYGAEVTAVCSTDKVETAKAIGADHVIDYTKENIAESGEKYDLMLDIVGTGPIRECKEVLKPEGRYVVIGGPKGRILGPLPRLGRAKIFFGSASQKMAWFVAEVTQDDLIELGRLMASGQVEPVIEGTRPLAETIEALQYLGEGHSRGKTVIVM